MPTHSVRKCLDIEWSSLDTGTSLIVYGCNGGNNQGFYLRRSSGNFWFIYAKHSHKVLDVTHLDSKGRYISAPAGTPVVQRTRLKNTGGQEWEFVPVPSLNAYWIRNKRSGLVMERRGGSLADWTKIQVNTKQNKERQY